jgi:hypothetical protein
VLRVRIAIIALSTAFIATAGCGTDPDTRPETADYIIEAILAPRCGRAACHSSETREHNYAFDTIPAAIASINNSGSHGRALVTPGSPDQSQLVTVLTDTKSPMPPDSPLPQADIDLITKWVTDGAEGLQ